MFGNFGRVRRSGSTSITSILQLPTSCFASDGLLPLRALLAGHEGMLRTNSQRCLQPSYHELPWVAMSCHELPWIAKWNLDGFYPRWSKVQTACHICNGFLYSTNDVIPCYSNIFHYYLQYALSRRVEIFEVSSNPCEWKVRKTWKAFEGHYTIAVKTSGKRP